MDPFHQRVLLTISQDEITCFRISETWRKHTTPCFRYVYVKVVRFRCIRSNGNARKRHETGNGNTGYPSCFRNGLTCFCHVSVYGFLQFRPVLETRDSFLSLLGPLDFPRLEHELIYQSARVVCFLLLCG